jgi:hypothetical protein
MKAEAGAGGDVGREAMALGNDKRFYPSCGRLR